MNGNGEDGAHDDVMNDTSGTVPGADLVNELLREEPTLQAAAEALPASLEPLVVPAAAWDRLAAAVTELTPAAAGAGASPALNPGAVKGTSQPATPPGSRDRRGIVRSPETVRQGSAGRPNVTKWPRWGWTHPLTWLTAAAVAAVAIGVGTWGALQAGERARLADEQRVLSYWMANPDLRMVTLQEVGSATAAAPSSLSGRLGVVCILPDGRALLLQPFPAGRGKSYVVVGRGSGEDADLAVGASNVIRFDLAGADRVVVMVASPDGERVPIAWADLN